MQSLPGPERDRPAKFFRERVDLPCRGFQFEVGKTFEHKGKVEACSGGFHSCEYPLDCFSYYPPAESRYAETIATGEVSREDGGDSKIASATITIKAEISMHQMVTRAIEWIWSKVDRSLEQTNTGNQSAASNTGDYSAAEVSGSHSVAAAFGIEGKARASENSALVLCYRNDEGELIHIRASKVGENGIKPNTWYTLNENGEFVEVD
ncbi:hypothetical protein RGJ08_004304 [Serratia marcescens]